MEANQFFIIYGGTSFMGLALLKHFASVPNL